MSIKAGTQNAVVALLRPIESLKRDLQEQFFNDAALFLKYMSHNLVGMIFPHAVRPDAPKPEFPNVAGLVKAFQGRPDAPQVVSQIVQFLIDNKAVYLFPTQSKSKTIWSIDINLVIAFDQLFKEPEQKRKISPSALLQRLSNKNITYFKNRFENPKSISQLTPAQLADPRIVLEQWSQGPLPDFQLLSVQNEIVIPAVNLIQKLEIKESGQIQIFKEYQLAKALEAEKDRLSGKTVASSLKALVYQNNAGEARELSYYLPANQNGEFSESELEYHLVILADVYRHTFTQLFRIPVEGGNKLSQIKIFMEEIKNHLQSSSPSMDERYQYLEKLQPYVWALIQALDQQSVIGKRLVELRQVIEDKSRADEIDNGFFELNPAKIFQESEIGNAQQRQAAAEYVLDQLKIDPTLCFFESKSGKAYSFANAFYLNYMKQAAQLRHERHMTNGAEALAEIQTRLIDSIESLLKVTTNRSKVLELKDWDQETYLRGVKFKEEADGLKKTRLRRESFSRPASFAFGGGLFGIFAFADVVIGIVFPIGLMAKLIMAAVTVATPLIAGLLAGYHYSIAKTRIRNQNGPKTWEAPEFLMNLAKGIQNVQMASRTSGEDKKQAKAHAQAQQKFLSVLFPKNMGKAANHFISDNTAREKLKKAFPKENAEQNLKTLQAVVPYLAIDPTYQIKPGEIHFFAAPNEYPSKNYPQGFFIDPRLTLPQCLDEIDRIVRSVKVSFAPDSREAKYFNHMRNRIRALFKAQ